jgi:hypothetical protein
MLGCALLPASNPPAESIRVDRVTGRVGLGRQIGVNEKSTKYGCIIYCNTLSGVRMTRDEVYYPVEYNIILTADYINAVCSIIE